ncbi:MoaD/ThiS family protein [Candidatus Foliamicus sp.]
MRVRVDFFAVLRERAGKDGETLDTDAATPRELYRELSARLSLPPEQGLKVAVNDEFRNWEWSLADGDRVVFIPPVAGG